MNEPQLQRLLIRADGGPEIGLGHVMRCLALAQTWRKKRGPVTLVTRSLPEPVCRRLVKEGIDLRYLDDEPPATDVRGQSPDDAARLLQMARRLQPQAVVIDGYRFDGPWQSVFCESPVPWMMIDDGAHLDRYLPDFVLNQNHHAHPDMYRGKFDGQLLAGCQFVLLRNEFRQISPADNSRKTQLPVRLLVTLGGSDPHDVTERVIRGLRLLAGTGLESRVVSPGVTTEIRQSQITIVPFANNMAELMAECDVAICAGGSTNWEFCLLGKPRLVVVMAENQQPIADSLDRAGCCRNLGPWQQLKPDDLAAAIKRLVDDVSGRVAMTRANRRLVDGLGAERVCQILAAS